MDGILNIDKPAGRTSFWVVSAVKRLTGERRAGHAGTLDPDATGVLPVCIGQGTRIVEFLLDTSKTYRAEIEIGKSTDTYDASGKTVRQGDISNIDMKKVKQALASFRGSIEQIPPLYSAIKHRGQPLYRLARSGVTVQPKSRQVTVYKLDMISLQIPLITLDIECSRGTYIRSLANDIGEALGCGAYLKNLIRTRYGVFDVENAISLAQLEEAVKRGDWQQYLYPIDSVLENIKSVVVDIADETAIKTGSLLKNIPPENDKGKYLRAYSKDRRFLAILTHDKDSDVWRPKKVFV